VYASNIGVEYMHIWNHEQARRRLLHLHLHHYRHHHFYRHMLPRSARPVNWIREQIETPEQIEFTEEEKLRMLDRLCWSDHFEAFLANK
jgi:2-oxoglutarate dehydrogenase complex dehydrogenase (E1) component-like enzyme